MRLWKEESNVCIQVKDYGIGIPAEEINFVFERFYRVDKARRRKTGGTGLGLSIAKEIVKEHGGEIDMQSKEGGGTQITIFLPAEGISK